MKIEPQVWIGASAPEDVDQIENVGYFSSVSS